MITDLYLSHFKSIGEQSIHLNKINIIVGKNGSGKSNIVDAISFLSDIVKEDLDYAMTRRHGVDSVRQWSKYKPYRTTVAVKIRTKEGFGGYRLVFSSSRNEYRIQEESLEWSGSEYFGAGKLSSSLFRSHGGSVTLVTDREAKVDVSEMRLDSSESVLSHIWNSYTDLYEMFGYLVADIRSFEAFTIFPNTIRAPQAVSGATTLEADGKNIASIIKKMAGNKRRGRDRILRSLRAVLPQLTGINVRSTAGYYVPVFSITENTGETHELNMSQISDGTLRMLGILVAFHQDRAPQKIALEEPEQMIHPALLEIVRDAAIDFLDRRDNRQIFITTHSVSLLDLFEPEDVIAVEFVDGATRFGKVGRRQLGIVKSGLMTLGDLVLAEDLEID